MLYEACDFVRLARDGSRWIAYVRCLKKAKLIAFGKRTRQNHIGVEVMFSRAIHAFTVCVTDRVVGELYCLRGCAFDVFGPHRSGAIVGGLLCRMQTKKMSVTRESLRER